MALFRKILRTMLANKPQYLGAFFMVLISSMLMVGMTTVADNLGILFDNFSTHNLLGDAEFTTASEIDIDALESRDNAIIEKSSVVDYELKPGQTLRIFSANDKVNLHAVIEGKDLDENDILIDPLFAAANDLKIGDALTIGGKNYTISGIMVLPNYIYIVRSKEEMINDPKAFGIAVLSQADLDSLPGKTDFYAVRYNNRADIHPQEVQFKNDLVAQGVEITGWESTENNSKVTVVDLEVHTLSTMSKAIPGMLLALSIILIGILLRRMIQRESTVIGTLYALGFRKAELLRHYLIFPLLIAGSGGLVGALLGMAMVRPMLDFLMTAFTMPVASYHYNWALSIAGVLTPAIVLCLASYFVILRMLHASPAELMKGARGSEKPNFIERALNLERFSFYAKFQIREQVRSLSRTGFLLFGVIVATSLLLYGLTLQSSLDYMLNEGIAALYNLKYEYVFNQLQSKEPPAGFEQFNATYVTPQQDRSSNFYLVGALPDSTRLRLKDISGNKLVPDQVIMTKVLADKLKVGAGDVLPVTGDDDLQAYTLRIDAVADSAAGEFVFMPLDRFNQMLGMPAGSYIGIWGDEQLTFPEGAIRSTKSMEAIAAGIKNLISQTNVLVYTLTISAFILGLIILFLVTGMIIEENRATISLFKVLGYRPNEVNRLILDSNTIVVVVGYIIGVPVLIASVSALMQSLAGSMQMTIPTRLNAGYMLLGFVVVMFTYQVAKLLSKKKVNAIPMSEALKAGME
ncbi:MAG: ABC transporter permease [Anaerolineaceae bacterium]|nr:ABC transporter permease [Anaerolineaceae bacterium]